MTKAATIMNKLGAKANAERLQKFLIQKKQMRILNEPAAHEQSRMLDSIDNNVYENVRRG